MEEVDVNCCMEGELRIKTVVDLWKWLNLGLVDRCMVERQT